MSIPDYLRPVPDISTILFPLDEDARNLIEMNYSASACPNIETMAKPPDSPSTSLSKASEYLVKMNQKGYMVMQGIPPEQIRRSFNRSLKPTILTSKHPLPQKTITAPKLTARSSFTSPVKGETPIKLNQLKQKASNATTTASTTARMKLDSSVSEFLDQSQKATPPPKKKIKKTEPKSPLSESTRFKDPELKFFLTSSILKKMKKKISSLPFIIEEDAYVYVNKVEEKIVEIGHRMIHLKMLDSHKLSRLQLQQNTAQFVIEAKQVGNDVIRSAFKANLINIELASQNKDLVKEFPEFFPTQQVEKNTNTTKKNNDNTKNGFIPSKSSPLLSNFSSKSFQTQASVLSTTSSNITASNGADKSVEFNIQQDEALLRLFDPSSKKTNELPLYYRPDVAELKKPEYGITASTKPSTTLQTKKNLKKIANAYEQVLMRPSTSPMNVHFPNINSPTNACTEFQSIGDSPSTICLNLNLNIEDQQGHILDRKMPEVITNDFKRKPKIESKNVSSRTSCSSRKKNRQQNNEMAHTQPVCLPSLRDTMLSSRGSSVLVSTISSLATGRCCQPGFSRIESREETEQKEIANKLFWEVADPLGKAREGQFIDQLDTINKLSSEIDLNDIVMTPDISNYHPFDFESQPIDQEGIQNQDEVQNDDDQNEFNININANDEQNSNNKESKENNENTDKKDTNDDENTQSTTENYDMYSFSYLRNSSRNINLNEPMIGSYDINKSKTRIVTYLQQHECDFDDINQSSIYQRLDKIWEQLGFTINQKLEMVLKYSKTVEESSKLSEALDAWENAFANIKNYQLTYKNLQTFLTNEALVVPPQKRDMLFAQLNDELKTAIESVNRSASYLKSTYGDELLMKRKKVGDLISTRNIKLKMLITKIGIVQQETA